MPPSPGYLRENPNYRQAGDWQYDSRRNRINPRSFREKKLPPGSNMDVFHFKNMGYSTEEAEQMASEARSGGERTSFGGKGIERINRRTDSRQETSAPTGPTDDQRKWAKKFRESSTPTTTSTKAATPSADDTPGAASASARSGFLSKYGMKPQEADSRPPLRAAAGPLNLSPTTTPTTTPAPKEPLNFSRSALIEGAKKSGDFAKIRGDFNSQSAAAQTGMRMDKNGSMNALDKKTVGADGLTDFARERFGPAMADKAAARDFATGKSTTTSGTTGMVKQDGGARPTQAMDFSRTITSKYGGGTNVSRAPDQPGAGTMTDPLTGKTVPMKSYLAEQSAVQDTKFGPNAGKAGDGYFDPKAIRQSFQQQKRGRV